MRERWLKNQTCTPGKIAISGTLGAGPRNNSGGAAWGGPSRLKNSSEREKNYFKPIKRVREDKILRTTPGGTAELQEGKG